jgi:radical SAM protein with 4Fe4S-binding SPASM domain
VRFNPIFFIWGGEPFLYRDIINVLRYLKQNRLTTTIVTNGLRLADTAQELVQMQLEGLLVSLDGTEHVHNEIRGWDKCYKRLMEGVAELRREKERKKSILPYIAFLITISKDNVHELPEVFKIAETAGADLVVCYYSWFTNPEIGRQHVQIMQERLHTTPAAWNGYVLPVDKIDARAVQKSVSAIQSQSWKFKYFFIPDLGVEQIPIYYEDPSELFGYAKCVSPWLVAEIMPNGDATTCRDYPDYITGNIAKESILNIWNNDRYRLFRNTLKEEGSLPICSRCCGLMGF